MQGCGIIKGHFYQLVKAVGGGGHLKVWGKYVTQASLCQEWRCKVSISSAAWDGRIGRCCLLPLTSTTLAVCLLLSESKGHLSWRSQLCLPPCCWLSIGKIAEMRLCLEYSSFQCYHSGAKRWTAFSGLVENVLLLLPARPVLIFLVLKLS